MRTAPQRERGRLKHPAGRQILRACAVEVHMDDVERHECTINSSEIAVHASALQRSKHQLLFTYRKNPSVCPHRLEKKVKQTKKQKEL